MQTTGIHHHSVIVTDLNRARAFYRDMIGLEEVPIPPAFDFSMAWFAAGDQQIHLMAAARPDSTSRRHIALPVDDIAAARRRLEGAGLPVSGATPLPGAERLFTSDPDGNRIEIICWSRP